jgi:hypothetical protein
MVSPSACIRAGSTSTAISGVPPANDIDAGNAWNR